MNYLYFDSEICSNGPKRQYVDIDTPETKNWSLTTIAYLLVQVSQMATENLVSFLDFQF